jgi:GT2 family glycosyltransferase
MPFAVAICTRSRPLQLAQTIDALCAQPQSFQLLVVDQTPAADSTSCQSACAQSQLEVVRDSGTGLSRARNIAARRLGSDWIAYVDDDCLVEADWAGTLAEEIERHPEAGMISGTILPHGNPAERDFLPVSTWEVREERLLRGSRLRPWEICFGVCFAVRRSVVERLGGWDERLGPGSDRYPGADDMDFNYRFLGAGEAAYVTPRLRVRHDQWRSPAQVVSLYEGYSRAWAGFSLKHLLRGDVTGGARLWMMGVRDAYRMTGSAVRRRSRWRGAAAWAKWRGHLRGTMAGLGEDW